MWVGAMAACPTLLSILWSRDFLTACSVPNVTLAKATHAPMLPCDARLARSHGHLAIVTLV